MCTVSWLCENDGYHLLSNRDEKRTRGTALPPVIRQQDGVRYIAPSDGDFGGTWIGVNEYGVSICLVNGYGMNLDGRRKWVSRGLVVRELLLSKSIDGVMRRLMGIDLSNVAAFKIVVLERSRPPAIFRWDGATTSIVRNAAAGMPLISSSFDPSVVDGSRRSQFQAAAPSTVRDLERVHATHSPERGPLSVCMHRPDAHTVSFSRISVANGTAEFSYSPAAPCQLAPPFITKLPLAQ